MPWWRSSTSPATSRWCPATPRATCSPTLDLPPCDVVELPHHGSSGGLDEALLAELRPRLGVISVGPNTYGHPTPEMLDLLATAGVPCARTDQRGDIAVWADARGLVAAGPGGTAATSG